MTDLVRRVRTRLRRAEGRRRSPRVHPDVRSPRAGGNDTGAIRGMTRRSGSKLLSPDIPSIMP
jgi:hypothetical protein